MVSISINMTWFERRLRHHVLQCQVWWEAFLAQLVWDVSLYREKMVGKGNWSLANRLLHHVLGERAMFLQRAHCEIFMVHSSFFFPRWIETICLLYALVYYKFHSKQFRVLAKDEQKKRLDCYAHVICLTVFFC